MESTNGQGICQGHHGRAGFGWGWGYGLGHAAAPRQSLASRATTETTLSAETAASAPASAAGADAAANGDATTASLHYERQERTSLVIRTQEGDLVKLRFAEHDALAVDSTPSGTDDADTGETTVNLGTSTMLSVRIRGDLNDDELGAIRSVIEQAGTLAAEFFNGDAGKAFAMASELSIDSQQLAKVALHMRVREALTYNGSTTADIPALASPVAPPVIAAHAAPGADPASSDATTVGGEAGAASAVDTAADAADVPEVGTAGDPAAAESTTPATAEPSATDASAADASTGDVPVTDASATDASAALPQFTDPFVAMRSMLEFLTNLIDTFQADVAAAPESADAPADTGAEGPSGEDTTTGTPAEASLSFSLKLRIFVSLVTTTAAAGSTGGEPAGDGAPEAGDATGDAAVTTLTDAVETIAADSEPGYQAVA